MPGNFKMTSFLIVLPVVCLPTKQAFQSKVVLLGVDAGRGAIISALVENVASECVCIREGANVH